MNHTIHTVHIQPSGYTFTVKADETVLAAALRHGYQFPHSCHQAICGTCKGQLVEGKVRYDVPVYALTDNEREMGYALFCSAKPLTDLVIYIEGVVSAQLTPVRRLSCDVSDVVELSGHVVKVLLAQPPQQPLLYQAGQYLEILHLDASPKPFSIANAPLSSAVIELHIRHLPDSPYTTQLMQEIKEKRQLRIAGPYGAMVYQRSAHPLLLIAGGTGFSPFKAIIEQALTDTKRPVIYLYWGARTRADLYWHAQVEEWAKSFKDFYYVPVLSKPLSTDQWQGEIGLVHETVLKHHQDLSHYHVYASGPPEMVFAAQKAFLAQGLNKARFYSDLLDYLPK